MWACSICAASYDFKRWTTNHITRNHIGSQEARVVFDPNGTIAPMATPAPPVETDTSEDEDTNDKSISDLKNMVINLVNFNECKI